MKIRCLRFALVWLVSIGVGCTTAPVRYYTLTPPPEQAAVVLKASMAIEMRVHTPPQLKRSELIVRTGQSQVMLLDNERWASPVNDEIKDALRLELQRRLGRTPAPAPGFTKLTLDIDVQRLEAELGRYALLDAAWSAMLSPVDPTPAAARAITCTFHAEEKIRAGYTGMVEGYQREIGALAEAIVAALTGPVGFDAPCAKSMKVP